MGPGNQCACVFECMHLSGPIHSLLAPTSATPQAHRWLMGGEGNNANSNTATPTVYCGGRHCSLGSLLSPQN